ncbi:AzlC family ABC transporter permease [Saccharopolyspora sp. MS10]|uniref:AzlC family ABC transporter permease n=1 Tax=Saccharopolyspora sp. MS10 TaxID=3385973 RepID=UPI00399F0380
MRSLWRTMRSWWRDKLIRDLVALVPALAVVGASLGAIAVTKGVPLWLITLTAAAVFAGGSEFMLVGLLTAGAAPATAVLGGLLLNARHFPYGLAVGGLLGNRWLDRLVGSHLMVDESVAFALAERDPARRRRAYWLTGTAVFLTWVPSVALGGLLGQVVGDPNRFGLDAALPAAILALIVPALRDAPTLRAVLGGVVLAVATTPVLPDGLPVLVALLGVVLALPVRRGPRPEAERQEVAA